MSGRASRQVAERVCIRGKLVLETPAHFGNGDAVGLADIPLLMDPLEGKQPLLTGSSIAGALRSYLREYEHGCRSPGKQNDLGDRLFGRIDGEASYQSWLLVDDALGNLAGIELRDGVAIDPRTRTAEDRAKFDVELLEAGTTFDLSFELLLTRKNEDLLDALALALHGLERGEIGLGLRKRRGFGQCRVESWSVRRYRVFTPKGLLGWLDNDASDEIAGTGILNLLQVSPKIPDRREYFSIDATCRLDGSLLIRSGSGAAGSPDMVHLHSRRDGGFAPVLSGTSLAGVIRARALRIANTIFGDGHILVDEMFGKRIQNNRDTPSGSRIVTYEAELDGTRALVQSRVKINRLTGGAFPGALFSGQPEFGGNGATVKIQVTLQQPRKYEIGLLLLVFKDLWTGDLPLGGESSVGRGRVSGLNATVMWQKMNGAGTWTLKQATDGLEISGGAGDELEAFVQALHGYGEGV